MTSTRIATLPLCVLSLCTFRIRLTFGQSTERSIFTEARGSEAVSPIDANSATNGDFRVEGDAPVLDGTDEDTFWSFSDWRWSDDSTSFMNTFGGIDGLTKAVLTLGLHTGAGKVTTDFVRIDDNFQELNEVQNLPQNTTVEFTIDLLDHADVGYSAENILEYLDAHDGLVPFKYSDDAIVFYAKLELTFEDVCNVAAWNNPAGGSFSDDGNWLDLEAPGDSVTAEFNYGGIYTVTLPGSVDNNNLLVGDNTIVTLDLAGNTYSLDHKCSKHASIRVSSDAGDLTFTGGGTVNAPRDVTIGNGSSPSLALKGSTTLYVDSDEDGVGDLVVNSSGGGIATVSLAEQSLIEVATKSIIANDGGEDAFLFANQADFISPLTIVGQPGFGSCDCSGRQPHER